MKKILLLITVIAMLAFAACSMVACDGNEGYGEACTEHVDNNEDFTCDNCGEVFMPEGGDNEPISVTVTVKVKDHYGNAISGLVIDFINTEDPDYDVTSSATDSNGEVKVTLRVGEYDVEYTNTPIYHIPGSSHVNITESTDEWSIEFTNNTPNGTEEHPYSFYEEDPNVTMPAQASNYYRVYHAKGLVLYIVGEGYKITYNGNEYTPEDGRLEIVFSEDDMNSAATMLIENVTDAEITFEATVHSVPGSVDNPHVIEHDGAPVTVVAEGVLYDHTVYYSYTVTKTGKVTVSTEDENVYMVLRNGDVVYNTGLNDGIKSISIDVAEGDDVKISVVTTDVAAKEVGVDITFTVTLEETAEN